MTTTETIQKDQTLVDTHLAAHSMQDHQQLTNQPHFWRQEENLNAKFLLKIASFASIFFHSICDSNAVFEKRIKKKRALASRPKRFDVSRQEKNR
jgi:hypothetical protein